MLYQRQEGMQKRVYMSPMNVGFWDWVAGIVHWWPLCPSKTLVRRRARRWSSRHGPCSHTHACVLAVYINDSHCCHPSRCLLFTWPAGFGREAHKKFSLARVFRTWVWSVQKSLPEIWKNLEPRFSSCHAAWSCFWVPAWLPVCMQQPSSAEPHCLAQSTEIQPGT